MKALWSNAASSWKGYRARAAHRARLQKELEHRLAFGAFYDSLPLHTDPFYVFFTGGLLHWVTKTVQFVPPDVNLVLIGSGLAPEEVMYLHAYMNRPVHIIRPRVMDTTVWEWLFEVNRTNFGWLDVDCLVLNPQLFDEMKQLPEDVAMNGCWLTYQGWAFLATYFLYINQRVLAEMKVRVPGISPRSYMNWKNPYYREGDTNLLTDTARASIHQTGSLKQSFDTLQFYQLVCIASDYKVRAVRGLKNDPDLNDFCSEELLHLTGVSWYLPQFLSIGGPHTHYMIVRAVIDYLLLDAADPNLPPSYIALKDLHRRMLGGDPCKLRKHAHKFLRVNGFSEQAFSKPGLEFLRYAS